MREFTREVDEGLVIGDNVQVNVLEIQANQVRLAIVDTSSAPYYREVVLHVPSASDDEIELCPYATSEEDFKFEDEDSRLIPMA